MLGLSLYLQLNPCLNSGFPRPPPNMRSAVNSCCQFDAGAILQATFVFRLVRKTATAPLFHSGSQPSFSRQRALQLQWQLMLMAGSLASCCNAWSWWRLRKKRLRRWPRQALTARASKLGQAAKMMLLLLRRGLRASPCPSLCQPWGRATNAVVGRGAAGAQPSANAPQAAAGSATVAAVKAATGRAIAAGTGAGSGRRRWSTSLPPAPRATTWTTAGLISKGSGTRNLSCTALSLSGPFVQRQRGSVNKNACVKGLRFLLRD